MGLENTLDKTGKAISKGFKGAALLTVMAGLTYSCSTEEENQREGIKTSYEDSTLSVKDRVAGNDIECVYDITTYADSNQVLEDITEFKALPSDIYINGKNLKEFELNEQQYDPVEKSKTAYCANYVYRNLNN